MKSMSLSIAKFNSRSQPDSHPGNYYNSVTVTFRCDISYDIENSDIGVAMSRALDARRLTHSGTHG